MMVHQQAISLEVLFDPDDNSIDVRAVLSGPVGTMLIPVTPEPPGSTNPEERFWPVLRIGNKRFVLCEIDDTNS